MNMMDGPKFRRKHTSAAGHPRPAPEVESVPVLDEGPAKEAARLAAEAEAPEIARQEAEAETAERARAREEAAAEAKARRKAEFERVAREEALRRIRERRKAEEAARLAEEQRRAEERRKAEEAARLAEEQRRAEERRKAEEAARLAEEQRRAEERRKAEEAARLAEEQRRAEEQRKAEEAARLEPAETPTTPYRLTEKTALDPVDSAWARLAEITVDADHLRRNRIITGDREDPAHTTFDVLRTRLLQALNEHGWKRVAITSPGKDCGKTFTAANLAISLSRQENCRTLLMDLDMRRPNLHQILGVERPGSVGDMLRGRTPPEKHLRRMGRNPVNAGRNIAFALNDTTEAYASELLQDPRSLHTLARIEEIYAPDVVLFDLPPALFYDDVIAFRPLFDGVLLVIGGGLTTPKEIAEVERRIGEGTPLLGLVLNRAEGTELSRYSY